MRSSANNGGRLIQILGDDWSLKSIVKELSVETKQEKVALETSEESIFEEKTIYTGKSKPIAVVDNKKYFLFCVPALPCNFFSLC